MDHYPKVNVPAHKCSSHTSSKAHSFTKTKMHEQQPLDQITPKSQDGNPASPEDTSFSPSSNMSEQEQIRNDSFQSSKDETAKSKQIHADYAQYTDASPPYSEEQYEGKSEEQQTQMRMTDYSKEMNRMMGRQLVRDLKSGETKVVET
jgi:hypothetical protein